MLLKLRRANGGAPQKNTSDSLVMDPNGVQATSPSHSNSDGGGWSNVVQNKKGKGKKKKMKNARTLSLQTFFSEHGGTSENEQSREELKGLPEITMPDLSSDDLIVRESLFSYFSEVLRRIGPVKINGPELQAELDHLSEEGKELVGKHSDIAAFIGQSSQLILIDDLVCAKEDIDRARKLALDSIVSIVAARNNSKSAAAASAVASLPSPANATSNVWNSQTVSAPQAKPQVGDVDAWLQLPKVDSLFNYDNNSSSNMMSSSTHFSGLTSHMKPPDLSSPPPTLQRSASASVTNGFSAVTSTASIVPGSSRFGGLGSTSSFGDPNYQNTIESLNKRLQGLSMCNADLLTQLANKERQLQHFSKLIGPQEELANNHEKLKLEFEEARKEISRLQKLLDASSEGGEKNKDKPVSDNYLIISLQHQLESERLNSRNLKHQLELERSYSGKITEKHNFLLNRYHSSGGGGGGGTMSPGPVGGMGEPGGGVRHLQDSFGLRGLLANTSSAFREDVSRFSGPAITPPNSTTCFSITPTNKPNSYPASLHTAPSSSPPLVNSLKFSSAFGSGADLSLGDDFQRRLTPSATTRLGLPSPTQSLVNSMSSSQIHKP